MSKLQCICGELIRDNTDQLPYKGYVFTDIEFFGLFEKMSKDIAGFIQARLDGHEERWLAEYFKGESKMTDEDLVHTIIARHLIHSNMDAYQCPKCGRIHIERRDNSQRFDSFAPDEKPHRDVFRNDDV